MSAIREIVILSKLYIRYAVSKLFPHEQGMHEANLTREIHDAR